MWCSVGGSRAAFGGCPFLTASWTLPLGPHSPNTCLSTATVAAVYYSYYVLPDGTYCLAPPPPGADVAAYYGSLPAGVAVPSTTAPPPPGTTPPPPPTTADTSSGVTATTITTRCVPPLPTPCSSLGASGFLGQGSFSSGLSEGLCYLSSYYPNP